MKAEVRERERIKSIAELRKAHRDWIADVSRYIEINRDTTPGREARKALSKIIEVDNEFEAHWKNEADGLDDGHAKTCKCCNCFVASIYRRVLGGEAG